MKMFIKNNYIDGVAGIEHYIMHYSQGEKVSIENEVITKLVKFGLSKNYTYIGGVIKNKELIPLKVIENNKEGLTLEVVNLDIELKYNDSYIDMDQSLLGDNLLSIKHKDLSTTIINLNTKETVLKMPPSRSSFRTLDSKGDTVIVKFYSPFTNANHLAFIQKGELIGVSNPCHSIEKHIANSKIIVAIQEKVNSKKELLYLDYEAEDLVHGPMISVDDIRSSNDSVNDGCLVINNNSLYVIESREKELVLIKEFNSDSSVEFYNNRRFNSSNDEAGFNLFDISGEISGLEFIKSNNKYALVDFNGNIIEEDVVKIYDVNWYLLGVDDEKDRLTIYKSNKGDTWLYNANTSEKINLGIEQDYEIACLQYHMITSEVFIEAIMSKLSKNPRYQPIIDDSIGLYDRVNTIRDVQYTMISEFLCEELKGKKLFIKEKDEKITLCLIDGSNVCIISDTNDSNNLFDTLEVTFNKQGNCSINLIKTKDLNNKYAIKNEVGLIDLDKLLGNIESCKQIVFTSGSYEIKHLDGENIAEDILTRFEHELEMMVEELEETISEYEKFEEYEESYN